MVVGIKKKAEESDTVNLCQWYNGTGPGAFEGLAEERRWWKRKRIPFRPKIIAEMRGADFFELIKSVIFVIQCVFFFLN